MNLDSKVRFSAVVDRNGVKLSGGYREGITTMLTDEEQKMEIFHAGQRWASRKNLIHRIGKVKYSLTEYEKVKRITFPIDDQHLLLVSTDIDSDIHKIISDVLGLIGIIQN